MESSFVPLVKEVIEPEIANSLWNLRVFSSY